MSEAVTLPRTEPVRDRARRLTLSAYDYLDRLSRAPGGLPGDRRVTRHLEGLLAPVGDRYRLTRTGRAVLRAARALRGAWASG